MIDSHVHFWQLDRNDYAWITPDRPVLHRDFLPSDFLSSIDPTMVTGCIAVQAAPTLAETDFLLALANQHAWIVGVTGWTDLSVPSLAQNLDRWKTNPKLKGIRPMAAAHGADWLDQPEYKPGLKTLAERYLILEALVLPQHLRAVAALAQEHPDLQIVVNHAAKPKPDDMPNWTIEIGAFKNLTNVACKISGLTQQSTNPAHQRQVFDTLLDVFGSQRLMWGSDFPVVLETSDYAAWLQSSKSLLQSISASEATQITSGTAAQIYHLA